MPSRVFSAVAAESRKKRGYSGDLHIRVDDLVQQWLDTENGRRQIATGSSEENFNDDIEECTDYVKDQYAARYGKNAFGVPIIGFLFWPLIGGVISWLVQRTLDRMFPNADGLGRAAE